MAQATDELREYLRHDANCAKFSGVSVRRWLKGVWGGHQHLPDVDPCGALRLCISSPISHQLIAGSVGREYRSMQYRLELCTLSDQFK
jgi:hypothetical protein